ncbi:MAG: MoaD/ThiS family protein [Nitrospirales bacterium]|nr:MoaD/ThiS family protein [Nitrospira sp.]MDR4502257.1 MoaD/ThiS family protein [Nitrospirales bacterium]
MLTVKLFGMVKTLAQQQKELVIDFPSEKTVKDLVEYFHLEYPKIGDLLKTKKVLISVNQEIAHPDMIVNAADEIALLPPFSGGS